MLSARRLRKPSFVALALSLFWIMAAGATHSPEPLIADTGKTTSTQPTATATLVSGSSPTFGHVESTGAAVTNADLTLMRPELSIGDGQVRASVPHGQARAVATATAVNLLGGLVTADDVRASAETWGGGVKYSSVVRNLHVAGVSVGDSEHPKSFDLNNGAGTVTINTHGVAIRVMLNQSLAGQPAGTVITVAKANVEMRPSRAGTSLAPGETEDSGSEESAATDVPRQEAPNVHKRLTRHHFAFPVYGDEARVADDFGAARADTGAHQGNDIFAAFGTPVLAVSDGVLEKVGTLKISGNRLWLRNAAGDTFFYCHLSAFSTIAYDGRSVRAGEVIGFVGNTGDAEPTPPHLHFEIHPGDGDAIDPHPILTAWQKRRDVPPSAWLARYGQDTAPRPGALVELRDFIADS